MARSRGSIRVLHVDDDPAFVETAADVLEREGDDIDVVTETSVDRALDRLDEESVDCIVSDYEMSGRSGIDFLETVRETYPDLPFLLFTGRGSEAVASAAISAGVTDYLQKDTGTEQYALLANRIRNAVERTEAERERERLEARHREKANLLDQIFEQVPIHLYLKDTEARHTHVSTWYVDERDDVPDASDQIGKTDLEVYSDELASGSYEDDMRVIEDGEPIVDTEEYDPEQDEWNLTSKAPLYDEEGEIQGLIGVTRHITEQKEKERRLQRQNERLEEFASIVSHDLRNPLNVATGQLELVREECDSSRLDRLERALDRMETLIDDLLTLARQGQEAQDLEPLRLAPAVERSMEMVESDDVSLVVESDLRFRADAGRLHQMLENLVANAAEHGGPDTTVRVGALPDESGFYLADDGPGIRDDERERVFEAGYSTSDSGTGFGLSIVQEIAKAHGWDVRVTDSEFGEGPDDQSESGSRVTESPGARFEVTGVERDPGSE